MPELDDIIKENPDNLIYYNRTINGMPVARYIAAAILSDSKYENEDYYRIEDKLTEIIQYTFINIWVEQTSEILEPLEEGILPEPDKPMKNYKEKIHAKNKNFYK